MFWEYKFASIFNQASIARLVVSTNRLDPLEEVIDEAAPSTIPEVVFYIVCNLVAYFLAIEGIFRLKKVVAAKESS